MDKVSKFFSLNGQDIFKGLVITVLTAALTVVYSSLQSGTFCLDPKQVATTALTAGVAYLLKNLGTNSQGTIGTEKPINEQPK